MDLKTRKIVLSFQTAFFIWLVSTPSHAEGLDDHYFEVAATQLNGGESRNNANGIFVRGRTKVYDYFYLDGSFEDAEFTKTNDEDQRYGDSYKQTYRIGSGIQIKPSKYIVLYAGLNYGYTNLSYMHDRDSYASSYLYTGSRALFFNTLELFGEYFSPIDESDFSITAIGARLKAHANHGYFIEYSLSSNKDRAVDVGVQFDF